MKIVVNKLVGDLGEQWAIEIPVTNDVLKSKDPVGLITDATKAALRVVDNRLLEINMRLIEHNKMAQSLTPEGLLAVRQCVAVMYGTRTDPSSQVSQDAPRVEAPGQPGEVVTIAKNLEKALEATDEGGR